MLGGVSEQRTVFRIQPTALVAVPLLALCVTPLAFAAPGLQVLYAGPVVLAIWLQRERTTVDADAMVARYLISSRRLPWGELGGLMVARSGAVRAVTRDGESVRLPAVRVPDLQRLARTSGGAIDLERRSDAGRQEPTE